MAIVFNTPFDDSYLALTTKIPTPGAECDTFSSISDGIQTVSFSSILERHNVPGSSCRWCAWSGPPQGEDAFPPVLFSFAQTLTLTLSTPSRIFGFELMPNIANAAGETHIVQVNFFSGDMLVQSITKTQMVSCTVGNSGSRLFAVQTDEPNGPCIDRVVISVLTPNPPAPGFSIAQVRYAVCCNTCEPLCTDRNIDFTSTFTVGVPFTLADVGTPEFNGNFNFTGDCSTGTCLQTVMFTLCATTLECCITLGTVSFSGTADLLITVPATLETDCGPEDVSVFGAVTVPISQTCFSCDVPLVCPDICGLLDVSGLSAVIVSGSQIEVTGTVTFNCPTV